MNYFKTKVRYDKICDDGMQRTVTEEYLVDAMSWTEAEKRITEEMKDFISCEFTITDIRPFKISAYTSLALTRKVAERRKQQVICFFAQMTSTRRKRSSFRK